MAVFNLFRRDPAKPRLSMRERLHNTAARILPRMSRAHRKGGGGTDAARRAVVTGTLAVAAVGAVPAIAAAPSKDVELIRIGHLRDAEFAIATAGDGEGKSDAEFSAACEKYCEIEFRIHDIPAHTIEGLAVKARLALEYATPKDPDQPTLDDIIVSLLEDILRLAGRGTKA